MHVYLYECMLNAVECLKGPAEGVRSLGNEVPSIYESSNMGSRNRTQFLCKNSKFLAAELSL